MKNEYFIEISCKIDKLMWVFYKKWWCKIEKVGFLCKIKKVGSYAKIDEKFYTDVNALNMLVIMETQIKLQALCFTN